MDIYNITISIYFFFIFTFFLFFFFWFFLYCFKLRDQTCVFIHLKCVQSPEIILMPSAKRNVFNITYGTWQIYVVKKYLSLLMHKSNIM